MADDWVELTPTPKELGGDYAKKGKILVNLANATSIWPKEDGSFEIWFFAAGDDRGRFCVTEKPADILALRKK